MATNQRKKTSSSSSKTSSNRKNTRGSNNKTTTKNSSKKQVVMKKDNDFYHDEITLIVTLVVSLLLILSNFNLGGKFGIAINKLSFGIFGFIAYLFPYLLFIGVAFYISNRENRVVIRKLISSVLLLIVLTGFLELIGSGYKNTLTFVEYFVNSADNKNGGGIIGGLICKLLNPVFGVGAYVILVGLMIVLLMFITEKAFFASLGKKGAKTYESFKERQQYYKEQRELIEDDFEDDYDEEDYETYDKKRLKDSALEKRRPKIFTLKKPEEVEDENLQLEDMNSQSDGGRFLKHKKTKNKKENNKKENTIIEETKNFDMDEFMPTDIDNIPIHRGAYHPEGDSNVTPVYEEELRKKFSNKGNDYDIKSLANQVSRSDINREDKLIPKEEVYEKEFDWDSDIKKEDIIPFNSNNDQELTMEKSNEQNRIINMDGEVIDDEYNSPSDYETIKNQSSTQQYKNDITEGSMNKEKSKASNANQVENGETIHGLNQSNIGNGHVSNSPIGNSHTSNGNTSNSQGQGELSIPPVQEVMKEYEYPPLDLLSKPKNTSKGMSDRELKETALKLQKTLESFGVRVTITNVSCGPAVTRYELQPEQGVKVSKITSLADDIKLNLAAADIRIEAPIPGKAAVGIEVPNKVNTAVMFRELIENPDFKKHPSDIAFAVGKDIGGQTVVTDIAKMPHLLIAGATGSGKSVCINTLIMSILYKANPADVKLIMVDPKVVELSVYNGIPHLLIPVVTDPKKASAALNWAVMEMTDRYQKFAELGVRDIKGYNEKIKKVEYLEDEKYQKMPQIVIIVDELADLMMVAPGEVEDAICRLAQMARAAGLHLIIATQRPSVNVITGLIKANIPSRIAFSVSSAIDSRTIIDGSGAEKLLGKGDMLFFPSGYPKPVRIQGAFVSDKEVSDVVEFLSAQNVNGHSAYSEEIANKITSVQVAESSASASADNRDEYFVEAGKFIIDKDKASIGMLQRVYKIGFNRAARIMDQLCEAGVVGPEEGTKPRKVIMSMEEFEQFVDEYV